MKHLLSLLLVMGLVGSIFAQEETVITRSAAPDPAAVELELLVDDLTRPLYLTHAPDDAERLFVMQQGGIINIYDLSGDFVSEFLNLTERVTWDANTRSYTERGLLGLAFHPNYAENGEFFVNYTDRNGHTVVARYTVSDDSNVVDANSEDIIFTQRQPFPNHNGGHMAFGPDGYLYIGLGDGGAANDPLGAGQDTGTLLGSIIRIDVDGDGAYGIPVDNPFVEADGEDEIWAYGLRNPWRFSFDRATGDLYIGDVGQNQTEEISFQPANSAGGLNFGWNAFEGGEVFNARLDPVGVVQPIATYAHSGDAGGCSVTGGYVYRGEAVAELQGVYLYGDYCSGNMWAAYRDDAGAWQSDFFQATGLQISSFGEDANGELYVVDYGGAVYRIVTAQ